MKKVFPFMLLLATVFAFSACSSDDDEPDTGIIENIIGTWDATSVKVDNEWFDILKSATDFKYLSIHN